MTLLADLLARVDTDVAGDDSVAAQRAAFDFVTVRRAGAAGWGALAPTERGALVDVTSAAVDANRLDRDDLHWPTLTHPGSVVWPSLLGVAGLGARATGDFLAAGRRGYQTISRLAEVLGSGHRQRAHVTATAGSAGAAVACASLVAGADAERALAVACSTMGGGRQAMAELSSTAMSHRAHAAVAGLTAALTSELPDAVNAPLDGAAGYAATAGIELAIGSLDESRPVAVGEMTVRTHPVTGFAHTLVDAIAEALVGAGADAQVVAIRAHAPAAALAVSRTGVPARVIEAAWNLPVVAALAALDRIPAAGLAWPLDPAVLQLAAAVDLTASGRDDLAVRGELVLAPGDRITFGRAVPHGHPGDPVSEGELIGRSVALGSFVSADDARLAYDALGSPTERVATVFSAIDRLPLPDRRTT